jgi:rhodanese-related sulfurtransferase
MHVKAITPEQLEQIWQESGDIDLLDVRKVNEFNKVRVAFARNVPMHEIDIGSEIERRANRTDPLYVICKVGGRSHNVCLAFMQAGYHNVVNIDGGTDGCVQTGIPLKQGAQA